MRWWHDWCEIKKIKWKPMWIPQNATHNSLIFVFIEPTRWSCNLTHENKDDCELLLREWYELLLIILNNFKYCFTIVHFFYGDRDLNPKSCIYYASSLQTELSSRWLTIIHLSKCYILETVYNISHSFLWELES